MKLYYAPGTCALACWIALEWSGLDYQVEKVKLGAPDYLKVNPLGMVPALDVPDYKIVTQANAILNYIAERSPESQLCPTDSLEAQTEFNEIMAFLTGDFHPSFWPLFMPNRYTISKNKDEIDHVVEAAYQRIDRAMTFLDGLIGQEDHVFGNQRTVADPYAFVMAGWSVKTPKPWTEYPNLARFMRKMKEDEAVDKVLRLSK